MNSSHEEIFNAVVYQALQHISNQAIVDNLYLNVLFRVEFKINSAAVRGIRVTKVQAFNRVLIKRLLQC